MGVESQRGDLLNLYGEMLRVRRIEEAIAKRYAQQEMRCPVHLSIGQEAVPVGVAAHLGRGDWAVSAHRSHAHYLAMGGNLIAMLAEIYGREAGCAQGRGGSMHLLDPEVGFLAAVPIVGSAISIGVGAAWALKLRGQSGLVVVYLGDGATEEGVFSESLDFAALHRLPVLFVCENNLYSVYTRIDARQPQGRTACGIASAHGLRSVTGNGNDVLEVSELVGRAVDYVRAGDGPALLEFSTYRWLEHCGPNWDDEVGYRPSGELQHWIEEDPLGRARDQLMTSGQMTPSEDELRMTEIDRVIEDAFDEVLTLPFPDVASLTKYLYPEAGANA